MEMGFDADIGRWILEFILRQPLDDSVLKPLISICPLPNDSSSLKKALLLRRIESEISNGSVSETLLDFLEQIEELDFQGGVRGHSGSISAAYLAVAVVCTVKYLGNSGDNSKFEYFDAVRRIWKGRICKLEKTVRLVSEDLQSWKDDIEAAVWENSACGVVLKKSEMIDAIGAVSDYVREEREKMGPSFLESFAETLKVDQQLRDLLEVEDKGVDLGGDDGNSVPKREVQKGNALSGQNQDACRSSKCALAGMNVEDKIANIDFSDVNEPCKQDYMPTTPEVNSVLEALKLSSLELQAAVKDPLPDSLLIAENALTDTMRTNVSHEPMEECQARPDPLVVGSQAQQANEENLTKHSSDPQNHVPKPSLMARNGTACTFEWDDSIDGVPDDSVDRRNRLQLPSPKRRVISPLKIDESPKGAKRRKPKKWSILEEDTLRTGVQEYGKGNWKLILKAYSDIFEERTEVDLKDKWRNLTKY